MKTIIKHEPVMAEVTYYLADDGTQFMKRNDCEEYEYKQELNKREIPFKEISDVEGYSATVWYLNSSSDYTWLCKTQGLHKDVDGLYTKPGWYIVHVLGGGDYRDTVYIEFLEDYLNDYQEAIYEIKHLTFDENMV